MEMRSVDWSSLPEFDAVSPTMRQGSATPALASLLRAFDELLGGGPADVILKRAVEIARERIGFQRAAIFMRDEVHGLMRGTWGTDLEGATVDEHAITFDLWEGELELYERRSEDGVSWTVVEDAPIVAHSPTCSHMVGRGWVCCTPIRAGGEPLGIMFNDAGLTDARVDEEQQAKGAMLCSLLGTALYLASRRGHGWDPGGVGGRSPGVVKATQLLSEDPAMTAEDLGVSLGLSASRVARLFKSEMGISLVEYRNRLRLARFSALLDGRGDNLLDAALSAGFGSYAQFHRVFVALKGTTPGKFLRDRARQK
jgi:AraC-like DNA-binding protein